MSKKLTVGLTIVCLLGLGGSAFGELNTIDAVPAATLLLPYFEVDLNGGVNGETGVNTLFSINNASAAATIAHVTLWTNESVPSLDFDVYLTGYDVQTISLSRLFNGGFLPRTADDLRDPIDAISPQGVISEDISFPNCAQNLPLPVQNDQTGGFLAQVGLLDYIQDAHTGNLISTGGIIDQYDGTCIAFNLGDEIARGYITVDATNECSLLFPTAPAYFAPGGTGVATNDNILWGDYFIVDDLNAFSTGDNLVSIEAANMTGVYVQDDYTFYGRYVGWSGIDEREPLASVWATRNLTFGDNPTDLLVWRDSKSSSTPHVCGGTQNWFPLNQTQVVGFDEQENPTELCVVAGLGISPPPTGTRTCFPLETQRVPVQGILGDPFSPIQTPYDFGWLFLNLNSVVSSAGAVAPLAGLPPMQNHVSANHSAAGRFQVGYQATVLVHTSSGLDPVLPVP